MGRTGEHAPQSFTGFDRLADRAVAWLAERRRAAREREAARRAENPPPLFPRKRWDAMPPERRAELWAAHDAATETALGSPSIMTYGAAAVRVGGNLSRMGALVERGASNATIRRLTRYEKGPFGYGVETGSAFLRPSAYMKSYTGPSVGRLSEVADVSDGVVKAYPDIGKVAVEIVPDSAWTERIAAARRASAVAGDGKVGAYAPAQDLILVRGPMPSEAGSMAMTSERMDRTLVHEMQHVAQARDGLLGKTAGDYRTAAKEVDARNSANRRWLGPAERREMPRANTQDVRPEEVHMDDKGGKSPHENFRNFLATDEVPETIFGIPVVQDESGYTEKDIEFFRENPKAAGFYETGDGEDAETPPDEDRPAMDLFGGDTRSAGERSKAAETFDTPIPEELKARYDAWYAQLPKNLQYTGDYDLQGAWLEKLGRPDKYEATQNGHLDDYGKKPNHITFSTGSKWHDPKVPERTGGEWRQAKDGSWDFYPGTGNKASDDELKAYFDKYEKGNRVHGRDAAKDVHGLVQKFKDHVRTYENRRVEPYRDVDGNWAVGYGSHFLADGTKVTPNMTVTDWMIDDAFDADLARRVDLLAGHDRRQAKFAVPNWRYMSPESRLMLLDVSWGRKDTLTERKSPGLFRELRAAGRDKAALDDAVRRHYPSYRKATDANGAVDESKTAGLQNRRIALLKALTGEDFSYDGKKWSTEKNKFVEE